MAEIKMNSKEMAESDVFHRRHLFEIGGKAKQIRYAFPVEELAVRGSISEALLTFVD